MREIYNSQILTSEIPTGYDPCWGDTYQEVLANRIPTCRILTCERLTSGLATGEIPTGRILTIPISTGMVVPIGYLLVGYIPVRDLHW